MLQEGFATEPGVTERHRQCAAWELDMRPVYALPMSSETSSPLSLTEFPTAVPASGGGKPAAAAMSHRRSIAVFCAAAVGTRPEYREAAELLGRLLAERGLGLIYGGADVGLMGAVADAALAAGGHVTGVIPQVLVDKEVIHTRVQDVRVVDTMHTRKRLMGELAFAFLILPGGFGTFEELFEVLAWQTLKLHAKPVVLVNTAGFYDKLLEFMDVCEAEGMLRGNRGALLVADSVEEALDLALSTQP